MDIGQFMEASDKCHPKLFKAQVEQTAEALADLHITLALHGLIAVNITETSVMPKPFCRLIFVPEPMTGHQKQPISLNSYLCPTDQMESYSA